MARYDHLPIFDEAYKLNLYFFNLSRGFAKDYKYGLGQEIRACLTELLDAIIIANSAKDKRSALAKASLVLERVRFKVRLLKDMRVIKIKSYEHISGLLDSLGAQVKKWFTWAKRQQADAAKAQA